MSRTCARMKPSASPKPASGPVLGLTWPILITADCASAGSTRSTAGAATAPKPAFTNVRREIVLSVTVASRLVLLSGLFQMLQHFRAQRLLLFGRPLAKALARFEAELTVLDEFFEIGRCVRPRVDRRQHGLVDRERQIEANHVGIFQRTEHRKPPAERGLDHRVDRLRVADAVLDQR